MMMTIQIETVNLKQTLVSLMRGFRSSLLMQTLPSTKSKKMRSRLEEEESLPFQHYLLLLPPLLRLRNEELENDKMAVFFEQNDSLR